MPSIATLVGVLRSMGMFVAFLLQNLLLAALYPILFVLHWIICDLCGYTCYYSPMFVTAYYLEKFTIFAAGLSTDVEFHPKAQSAAKSGPVIYAYNHTSNLDPLLVGSTAPGNTAFVYKKELGKVPLFGFNLRKYYCICLDRKDRTKAVEALKGPAMVTLRKGHSLAVAPEGTRSLTGELMPFKQGPFHLSQDSNIPIVPVCITGAFDILKPHSVVLRGSKVAIRYLEPIYPKGHTVASMGEATRAAMVKALDQMPKGAALKENSLAERLSAFFKPFAGFLGWCPVWSVVQFILSFVWWSE